MQTNEKWPATERQKLATLILEGGLMLGPEHGVEEYRDVISAVHAVLNKPADVLETIRSKIEAYAERANG